MGAPFPWEDLLVQIEDHRVVPVIGPDLSTIRHGERDVPLDHRLGVLLAQKLGLEAAGLPENFSLRDVALRYVTVGGKTQRVYSSLKVVMNELNPPVPEPLRQLAAITDFNLYLSTTFDGLLANALDAVRYGGSPKTQRLAYSPQQRVQDLPCTKDELGRPVVYQIFGPLYSSTEYVVTEEDMLEFVNALQSVERRPKLLFDELRANHLLIIGCGYSDWLSRFFIRTVRNERLSLRNMSETIADDHTPTDTNLVHFLQYCAADVFLEGGARAFVAELFRRWQQRQPSATGATHASAPPPAGNAMKMKPDAIFLSYASEDRDLVELTRQGLESVGLDVWFDQRALQPGADWDQEIQRNIRNCSLFVPFLSRHSTARLEGYFRKEWNWAIDRSQGIDERFAFIHPVALDDTQCTEQGIPEPFRKKQWHRFSGGTPTSEFIENAKALVRELRLRKAGVQ
jgi:hypothetical protein